MPRYYPRTRAALRMRPVNSNKETVDSTTIGVAAGTVTTVNLSICVNDYTGVVGEVPLGSRINSIYLFKQILPQAAQGQVDWLFGKNPGNQITLPAPGTTGGHVVRKWVLHEEKGIPGTFNNGASPLTFRGVLTLPNGKGMKRQGEADRTQTRSSCSTAYDMCLKAIYKRYV